jgi:farnesol dehydrogenase
MRVLVTGVTGFLGGRVAQLLTERGHQVIGFCRNEAGWNSRPESAEVATGDVTDRASVERAVESADVVVHGAALVKNWVKDKRQFDLVNVNGLGHMIEAARDSCRRLVYVSSFVALGPTNGETFDEQTPRAVATFNNDYERTKWLADQLARNCEAKELELIRVYPGVVFGPGALTDGNHVVQLLLQHAAGKLPGMLGSGELRQCFSFVDDVASGVCLALERGQAGEGYILGGENRTGNDLFAAFESASGVAPPTRKIPFGVAALIGKVQRWRAELLGIEPELTDEVVGIYRQEWAYSSAKAQRELDYTITPFETAIERTVQWLRDEGQLS